MIYKYYEEGYPQTFTACQILHMWDNEIDQTNFHNFACWLDEMIDMQIFLVDSH